MIIRDEEGKIVSAETLADVNGELKEIIDALEDALKSKKKGKPVSEEEKEKLNDRAGELKALIASVGENMKNTAKPLELLTFVKNLAKLKKISEEISELKEND